MVPRAGGRRGGGGGPPPPSHNEASLFSSGQAAAAAEWGPLPRGRPPRLTVDTSALNARGSVPAMCQIERWAEEGRVELLVPPEVLEEASAHRGGKGRGMYAGKARALEGAGGGRAAEGATAGGALTPDDAAALLFPHTRPARMTPGQRRDARILSLHHRLGGDFFITLDTRHFIQKGRRERLAQRGVRVMTPAEFVACAEGELGGVRPGA